MRRLFMVLSPRALPYAEKALVSLFNNALEPLNLTLITDSPEDKTVLIEAVSQIEHPPHHQWQVFDQADADERASEQFKGLDNLQAFRFGHPCWRKVTDPFLFSNSGEEMIILDPDLYFPNQFTFEPTPEKTVLLMWQPPNCLYPPESVYAAFDAPVKLANHVDIGVAQLRPPIDLEWFDWFVARLGGKNMPRIMHIEAIVWSALLMKMGGGHLNPQRWRCWHRSQGKRVLLKLGVPGTQILKMDDLTSVKCFHAGGPAKWWIKEAYETGLLDFCNRLDQPSEPIPVTELTRSMFDREQFVKGLVRKLGYYAIFKDDGGGRKAA